MTVKITMQAETPTELRPFVQAWLDGLGADETTGADEGKIRLAISKINGQVSRRFLREVAEAGRAGKAVTIDTDLGKSYGFNDGGSLGGAIGTAASTLFRITGRWVLGRVSRFPSVWRIREADAVIVLATLDELQAS